MLPFYLKLVKGDMFKDVNELESYLEKKDFSVINYELNKLVIKDSTKNNGVVYEVVYKEKGKEIIVEDTKEV